MLLVLILKLNIKREKDKIHLHATLDIRNNFDVDILLVKKVRLYKVSCLNLGQTVSEPGVEERSCDNLFSAFSLLWFCFIHNHTISHTSTSMSTHIEIHIYVCVCVCDQPFPAFMHITRYLEIFYLSPLKCPQLLILNIWNNGILNKIQCA